MLAITINAAWAFAMKYRQRVGLAWRGLGLLRFVQHYYLWRYCFRSAACSSGRILTDKEFKKTALSSLPFLWISGWITQIDFGIICAISRGATRPWPLWCSDNYAYLMYEYKGYWVTLIYLHFMTNGSVSTYIYCLMKVFKLAIIWLNRGAFLRLCNYLFG